MVNLDEQKTLGFRGDQNVEYSDVRSGGEGMKMLMRISGEENSMIKPPFMIFKNVDRSYPIRGLEDN